MNYDEAKRALRSASPMSCFAISDALLARLRAGGEIHAGVRVERTRPDWNVVFPAARPRASTAERAKAPAKGGASKAPQAPSFGDLTARVEKLRESVRALRADMTIQTTPKELKMTTKQTQYDPSNYNRSTQGAALAERCGLEPKAPAITFEQGAVVLGVISKADGRILARMSPADRRELAKATGAAKVRLWNAAKARVMAG